MTYNNISLNRTSNLFASNGFFFFRNNEIVETKTLELYRGDNEKYKDDFDYYVCYRKLLNSDNTDATLFDQDQSTQDAIALLLGWKEGN